MSAPPRAGWRSPPTKAARLFLARVVGLPRGADGMPTKTSGIVFSVVSSLIWGCYPVLGRYVQTKEPGRPSAVALLALLTLLDSMLIVGYMGVRRCCAAKAEAVQATRRKRVRFAAGYGGLCVVRMWTNMQSTRMTAAFNIQMTALLLPFITSGLAYVLLRERIHWALPPTLLVSLVGCVLTIGRRSDGNLTWLDAAGIGLQGGSVVCSALVKIALKGSEGVLSKAELMLSQMLVTASVMLTVGLATDTASFAALARMDVAGWACFFALAIGVYVVGNLTQIIATRAIGASNHSASNSLRLVSAGLGSWLLLDEAIDSVAQWCGLVLITLALAAYWLLQRRDQRRAAVASGGEGLEAASEAAKPAKSEADSQKLRYAKLATGGESMST